MSDYVVDTNVWVQIDVNLANVKTREEALCVIAAQAWIKQFMKSGDKLVTDLVRRQIIGEYRNNILKGGLAEQYLNALETQPRDKRLVEVEIAHDSAGFGLLPFHLRDPKDRKFAAVALAHKPTPPIIDATDTDWEKDKAVLAENGLTVTELCPAYIQKKLAEK